MDRGWGTTVEGSEERSMTKFGRHIVGVLLPLIATGCSGAAFDVASVEDTGADQIDSGAQEGGPITETGPADAGPEVDTGSADTGADVIDAGATDTNPTDSGTTDASTPETDATDASPTDGGAVDTGTDSVAVDTATPETGAADAATIDTGTTDSGPTDSGDIDGGLDTGTTDSGPTDMGTTDTTPTLCNPLPAWDPTTGAPSGAYVPGSTRCNGAQVEYCSADGTAWLSYAGACGYGCTDATATTAASCQCTAPTGRFVTVADSKSKTGFAIKDTKTGLTWADNDSTALVSPTYSGATLTCGSMGIAWRLPKMAEVQDVLGQTRAAGPWGGAAYQTCSPDVDIALKLHSGFTYWTGDTAASGYSWAVTFSTGDFQAVSQATGEHIRCVHD